MSNDAATAANATSTRITTQTGTDPTAEGPDTEPPALGLGVSLPPADARAKTEGTFPYAADLWAEGLLWAAVLRSPHPHARILSIDTSAAVEMTGVRAVITHEDIPGRPRTDAGSSTGRSSRPTWSATTASRSPRSPPTTRTRPGSPPRPSPSSTRSWNRSPTRRRPSPPNRCTPTAT